MALKIDTKLSNIAPLCFEPNLTPHFSDDELAAIGNHCWAGYERDSRSRESWLRRTSSAMDLAMQVSETKTFPWPNCSNIAFPVVTIAALQFHSRSYPAMFAGPDIVKYRVPGVDQSGELTQKARLVSRYMSHQALDLDQSFEEQHDRLLINVPIVGCAFVKTKRDSALRTNTSSLVLAHDFVVDYHAKSVDGAMRKTQIMPLFRNEVHERCIAGTFRNVLDEPWYSVPYQTPDLPHEAARDHAEGVAKPEADEATPLMMGEQHCWLDLDGDGYAEPYIVTFDLVHKKVFRIAARWNSPDSVEKVGGKIMRIVATEYYTKYGLIPAPDGSIYDIGFGVLLGPLNESVNTIVNQLVDAGTISNTAGGFLSKGVKMRGGAITFQPFGWQRVESTGDDLQKGIFPLPVREPSQVLFSLLQLLINYTQRISGSGDTMVGENPGQNTPANNMNIMVEQGMQVYSAVFKRMWRSMRDEFRKAYLLNAYYISQPFSFGEATITKEMFLDEPANLVPSADPNLTSESQRLQQAVMLKTAAAQTPGYDIAEVERNFLRTLRVDGIDQIYPGPDKVPQGEDVKVTIQKMKLEGERMKLQASRQEFIIEMMETQRLNRAKILNLETQAAKYMADAGQAADAQALAEFQAMIDAIKTHNESISKQIQAMAQLAKVEQDGEALEVEGGEGGEKPALPAPDPAAKQMAMPPTVPGNVPPEMVMTDEDVGLANGNQ